MKVGDIVICKRMGGGLKCKIEKINEDGTVTALLITPIKRICSNINDFEVISTSKYLIE